jgi:hypothetical protein
LAPSGAGLLKVKVFWRQKARVVLRLKISGMIQSFLTLYVLDLGPGPTSTKKTVFIIPKLPFTYRQHGGQNFNLYLNVVRFLMPVLIRHLWHLMQLFFYA